MLGVQGVVFWVARDHAQYDVDVFGVVLSFGAPLGVEHVFDREGMDLETLGHPLDHDCVVDSVDMALVVIGFGVLKIFKPNIVLLVAGFAAVGALLSLF